MDTSVVELILQIKDTGAIIEIENRDQGDGWYDYGFPTCHGKFVHYCNPADNEAWDALVLGYRSPNFSHGQRFRTNNIIGIVWVEDGNHKLLVKVPYKRGFDHRLYNAQLHAFMQNYHRHWPTLGMMYLE